MTPLIIDTQKGLGDNIYARPFVKALSAHHDLYLATPWPELYEDLPVHFVKSFTTLRTQQENIDKQDPSRWVEAPLNAERIRPQYYSSSMGEMSIMEQLRRAYGINPAPMDLPNIARRHFNKPLAIVRPVTLRTEWSNPARNPYSEYVAMAADVLRETHHVISIAHLKLGEEVMLGDLPAAHEHYHEGQLNIRAILDLVASADIVVGGVGWIVPAAIAANVRLYIIWGGHGGHSAKGIITDPTYMDLSKVGGAVPDNFCVCNDMQHSCNKYISNFEAKFRCFLNS